MPARFGAHGGGVAVAAAGGTPPHMMAFRQPAPAYKVGAAAGPAYGDYAPPARAAFPPAAYGGYSIGGAAVAQETVADDVPAGPPAASALRERALIPGRSTVGKCDLCSRSRRTVVVCQDGKAYCKVCRLQQTGATKAWHSVAKGANMAVDSDEELVGLCKTCSLPLGESVYFDEEKKATVHGECMAARILKGAQEGEDARQRAAAQEKRAHREAFDIGWKAERVPSNVAPARKLGCELSSKHGVCCLALEGDTRTLRVTESNETAACVNLEYLSLALNVRRSEGREPLFSLDPLDMVKDPERMMQAKRFEPAWLMGTSAGEVMFQADYYLKELSMGEYDQPVVGMKSCFDFSEAEGHETEWRAREWFVVKNAGVSVSEDNVLIPHVEMAIEAREQFNGADGIEDSPITREDHPLVKYADTFTRNFDLIAERKSAVYHLRELAKASVLAKFLVEGKVDLKDTWFHLAKPRPAKSLVIPQLWNDRCHSQLSVQDGKIVEAEAGVGSKKHSVYGGVEFGLDRFSISRPSLASGAMLARGATAQMSRVLGVTSVRQLGPPIVGQPLRAGIEAQAHLQGVDLTLSKFDLTSPTREKSEGPAGSWGRSAKDAAAGAAFWKSLKASDSPLEQEDATLLRSVFNPFLSDRRDDGEKFVPPDSAYRHVQSLKRLVEEEAQVRKSRKEHFCRKEFAVGDAGPLFPSSWTSSFELMRGQVMQRVPGGADVLPENYKPFTGALPNFGALPPVFDKTAEDGTRFRIYRSGGLEVRTTQEHDGQEVVGVVFAVSRSMQASAERAQQQSVLEDEQVAKVTEFVESVATEQQPLARNFYVVVETIKGSVVVTEMLENGTVALEANPAALPDRNARARVVRSVDCRQAGVRIRDVNACRERGLPSGSSRASVADRKHYSQVAYGCAKGEPDCIESGFSTRTAKTMAELQEMLGLSKTQTAKYLSSKSRKGTAFGGVLRL